MGWEWILLLLTLSPEPWATEEEDGVCFRIEVLYLETEKPSFASYSSLWNERLKQEARRAASATR